MVHAGPDDRRRAREAGATAVLCPRSNLHIGGRLPDVPALLADGVALALGTDSLASCPDLSVFGEVATLAARFPAVPALVWLEAATHGGAAGAAARRLRRARPGPPPRRDRGHPRRSRRAARGPGPRSQAPSFAGGPAHDGRRHPHDHQPAAPSAHVVTFGRMIKFEHTIFALPFALAAAALAARGHGITVARLVGIVVAMAAARTAAMGFNRIADRHIDAKNPRTARRELPAGAVSLRAAWTLTLASAAVFVGAAALLGPLCLALSPVALALLFGYSFTKRFTFLCHLFLGLAIASGPAGAWIAVRGDFGLAPGLLMIAVATWIAGFDILYALADRDFDRGAGPALDPGAVRGRRRARDLGRAPRRDAGRPRWRSAPRARSACPTGVGVRHRRGAARRTSTPSCAPAISRASTRPSSR